MPRAPEGCRALPAEGPGVAIQEALAAPAIGPRSETDLNALLVSQSLGHRDCVRWRASSADTAIPKL
jgi:hypothetical protein